MIHPLNPISVGEDTYEIMSEGHHDPKAFMAAVRRHGWTWPLGVPQHIWCIKRKKRGFSSWYEEVEVQDPKNPGCAIPITWVSEEYNEAEQWEAKVEK